MKLKAVFFKESVYCGSTITYYKAEEKGQIKATFENGFVVLTNDTTKVLVPVSNVKSMEPYAEEVKKK